MAIRSAAMPIFYGLFLENFICVFCFFFCEVFKLSSFTMKELSVHNFPLVSTDFPIKILCVFNSRLRQQNLDSFNII